MILEIYKSYRIINGKPKWVIVNNNGTIIDMNPTKEQIKLAIIKRKMPMENRICCICKNTDTYMIDSIYPAWYTHNCEKINCSGYLCNDCFMNFDSKSFKNLQKNMRKNRTGQIKKDSEFGKGLIIECVIAMVRGLKNINIELDNFKSKFDLSVDKEYGMIQSKSKSPVYGDWNFNDYEGDEFDTIFLVCMSKSWDEIKKMFAIPRVDAIKRLAITIYGNPSRSTWYEIFGIDKKPYNEAYHSLTDYLNDKKLFGIEDIKNWSKGGM